MNFLKDFLEVADSYNIKIDRSLRDEILSNTGELRLLREVLAIIVSQPQLFEDIYFLQATVKEFKAFVIAEHNKRYM